MKSPPSAMAKRAEVARFLAVDAEDIDRLIRVHGLPAVSVPGATRPGARIYLPDFHRWLAARAGDGGRLLADYAAFRREFDSIRNRGGNGLSLPGKKHDSP